MSPFTLLLVLVAITLLAWLVDVLRRRRWRKRMEALARELELQYCQEDRFGLGAALAGHHTMLPVPGAADLSVYDVVYALRGQRHVFIFTAEYTRGTVRRQRRVRQAMGCWMATGGAAVNDLVAAKTPGPLVEQYRDVHEAVESGKWKVESGK